MQLSEHIFFCATSNLYIDKFLCDHFWHSNFVLDSSCLKILENDVNDDDDIFQCTCPGFMSDGHHSFPCMLCKPLWKKQKKKNPFNACAHWLYRLLKKFPMPMPSGLHKWFFLKKCPARRLVWLKANTRPTLVSLPSKLSTNEASWDQK
jgi:hypothetical protein